MAFHVGQKVVCVALGRGKDWSERNNITDAVVGRVYTVRGTYKSVLSGKDGIWVQEIKNRLHSSGMEYGFYSFRFRRVVEHKTDISIFTAMLTPASKPVETASAALSESSR